MGEILDLRRARERRAERFIASAGALRSEMGCLCEELQQAVGRLEEARDAIDRARVQIEASRSRMDRVRRFATRGRPEPRRPALRLVSV